MKIKPSRKDILSLIYMRTLIEIEIEYDDRGFVKSFGRLDINMKMVYNRIVDLEKLFFAKKETRSLYMECLDIAKAVWPLVKGDKEEYTIHLEPTICGLYFDREKDLKKLGLIPLQFNRIYDKYFEETSCELEDKCRKLVDEIYRTNDKVMFDKDKEKKRANYVLKS